MLQFKFKLKKSVDGVLGIRTWGGRMEGANESTELRRHPQFHKLYLKFELSKKRERVNKCPTATNASQTEHN